MRAIADWPGPAVLLLSALVYAWKPSPVAFAACFMLGKATRWPELPAARGLTLCADELLGALVPRRLEPQAALPGRGLPRDTVRAPLGSNVPPSPSLLVDVFTGLGLPVGRMRLGLPRAWGLPFLRP